jgi:hypothetical protein
MNPYKSGRLRRGTLGAIHEEILDGFIHFVLDEVVGRDLDVERTVPSHSHSQGGSLETYLMFFLVSGCPRACPAGKTADMPLTSDPPPVPTCRACDDPPWQSADCPRCRRDESGMSATELVLCPLRHVSRAPVSAQ